MPASAAAEALSDSSSPAVSEHITGIRPTPLSAAEPKLDLPSFPEISRDPPRRGEDLIARARVSILERLANGTSSLEEVARSLGVSARTLQRRLHEQNQTLSRLLDECRRQRVMELLARGEPTKAIALDTGFGDVPALYRAFRRWTGTTPRRYAPRTMLPPALAAKTA
jgi:AraC-like DNA-binding protein